ncbi:hypothetical protein, partial [Frankia sp. AgKG'84/4]|uniref:hypothetical protein n=1 Tax=Frankia sp. AgKG'84/4 TaxID=573490 RepID=UPI00202A527B
MNAAFEWDRILIATTMLAAMFVVPALVIWRDQIRDRRRFGMTALSRPVRYGADGRTFREGSLPPAGGTGVEITGAPVSAATAIGSP